MVARTRASDGRGTAASAPIRGERIVTRGADQPAADQASEPTEVGPHVAAVLASAEQAAARIRSDAEEEAERLRRAALEQSERRVAKAEGRAERELGEARELDAALREAAQAYAEATRQEADLDAARIVDTATASAEEVVAAARAEADRLVQAARRKYKAVSDERVLEGRKNEARLRQLHEVFTEMTEQLAELRQAGLPHQVLSPSPREEARDEDFARSAEPDQSRG